MTRMSLEERRKRREERRLARESTVEFHAQQMAEQAMKEVRMRMAQTPPEPLPPSSPTPASNASNASTPPPSPPPPAPEPDKPLPPPEELSRQVDLSTGPLMKLLTEAGLGNRYVDCLKEIFEKDNWAKLDAKEKKNYLSLVVKLLELSEGAKITLKMESEAGATHEELSTRKKALMRQWSEQLLRLCPPASSAS